VKIVLDTNCLVVALPKASPYRWLWNAFRSKRFTLCFTTEILQEYTEILTGYYSAQLAENVINALLNSENVQQVTVFYKWGLITADFDDNKFVDCAIGAGADYIITHDKHFNVLADIDIPKLHVLDVPSFKDIVTSL
jgi:putative PIN family toxin of toxin-antitoxin system